MTGLAHRLQVQRELLDRIAQDLEKIRALQNRAFEATAKDSVKAASECVYAFAAGQCRHIVDELLARVNAERARR